MDRKLNQLFQQDQNGTKSSDIYFFYLPVIIDINLKVKEGHDFTPWILPCFSLYYHSKILYFIYLVPSQKNHRRNIFLNHKVAKLVTIRISSNENIENNNFRCKINVFLLVVEDEISKKKRRSVDALLAGYVTSFLVNLK